MKFVSEHGLILESTDAVKIEIFKAQGFKEYIENPQPSQEDIKVVDEYTVKKKPVKKKTK